VNQADRKSTNPSREHGNRRRPPLLKMTRALVLAAIFQGQPKMALQLLANGIRTATALPALEQLDLVLGVVQEAAAEVKPFVVARAPGMGATG
jgi:hypothetical protein